MKKNKMAIIDKTYNTVELVSNMEEVMEVINRYKDDFETFTSKMVVSEDKMLEVIDEKKITIVNYFDVVSEVFYEELTYNEYKIIEEKNELINYMVDNDITDDAVASYRDLKSQLDKVINTFFELEEEEGKWEFIDKQYITIGINGNNHNFYVCADLYNELCNLMDFMIEIEG